MDPLRPHSHANNATPPDDVTTFELNLLNQETIQIAIDELQTKYPVSVIESYTYQTDHGKHGPYKLEGVSLVDLLEHYLIHDLVWTQVEVLSADGFGNRIYKDELLASQEPILLCFKSNDEALTRGHGLVRLVVPFETDNALRQVKWVRTINILDGEPDGS